MINMAGIYASSSIDSALLVYSHLDGDFRETVKLNAAVGSHGDAVHL